MFSERKQVTIDEKRKMKIFYYKNIYYTWTGTGVPQTYHGFGYRPLQ